MQLKYLPDPFLFKTLPPFDFEDPVDSLPKIEKAMAEILVLYNGLGISANQIGVNARIFLMNRKTHSPLFCINPEILQVSRMMTTSNEGCLSDPGNRYRVDRPRKCKLAYSDQFGNPKTVQLVGIDARCALHEIDHLNGINIRDGREPIPKPASSMLGTIAKTLDHG